MRRSEIKFVGPTNFSIDADTPIKVNQVGAAAHQDMLTIVQGLARLGVGETGGAAAQSLSRLDEAYLPTTFSQPHRCGDACQAATNHHRTIIVRVLELLMARL